MPNETYYQNYEDEDREELPAWDELYEDEEPWSYYD